MKRTITLFWGIAFTVLCYSQQKDLELERVSRIMIINPGFQFEFPISQSAVMETYIDIGYESGYKKLIEPEPENNYTNYMIVPSLGIKIKRIYRTYNFLKKGKDVRGNSGSYLGGRFLFRGPELYAPFTRTDAVDFSIGPVWGLQRTFGKFYIQGDIGPLYYFDTKGNQGVHFFNLDIVFGISLTK